MPPAPPTAKAQCFRPWCIRGERVAMLTAVRSLVAGKYTMWKEELWTKAVPEQQRLTIQLVRNTIYFTLSTVLITVFGDQLAV